MKEKNTAPTTHAEKKLLTTPEAANLLGLKPETLEIWRWAGRGPNFYKLGRAVRYKQADLDAFIDAGYRLSTEEG